MAYRVVITPFAKNQLEMYISYTLTVLKNKQAAREIREDALRTKRKLSDIAESLALCDNELLKKYGYRRILFDKHDFFMVYRVDGNTAVVEAMYHVLQDYEQIFAAKIEQP